MSMFAPDKGQKAAVTAGCVLFAVTLACFEHVEVDKSLEFRDSVLVQYRLSVHLMRDMS